MKQKIPNLITLSGHLLTIVWLINGNVWFGVAGLLCDALDGWIARRLGCSSHFGSMYDWTVDVTIASAILQKIGLLYYAPALVLAQTWARQKRWHVSGRAALTVYVILKCWIGE